MAEKNIAYLVREDTKTIGVRFFTDTVPNAKLGIVDPDEFLVDDLGKKEYTYVTNIDFKLGDLAIVKAVGQLKVVYVSRVDTGCEIEPNQSMKFSWVVGRVDTDAYAREMEINSELEATVNRAYKANVKNQFRQLLLGTLDEKSVARIAELTKGGKKC